MHRFEKTLPFSKIPNLNKYSILGFRGWIDIINNLLNGHVKIMLHYKPPNSSGRVS